MARGIVHTGTTLICKLAIVDSSGNVEKEIPYSGRFAKLEPDAIKKGLDEALAAAKAAAAQMDKDKPDKPTTSSLFGSGL